MRRPPRNLPGNSTLVKKLLSTNIEEDDADDDDDFLTPSKVASEPSEDEGKYMASVNQFAHLLSSKLAPSPTPHAASAGGSPLEKVRSVFS